jgi:hypothetical protein
MSVAFRQATLLPCLDPPRTLDIHRTLNSQHSILQLMVSCTAEPRKRPEPINRHTRNFKLLPSLHSLHLTLKHVVNALLLLVAFLFVAFEFVFTLVFLLKTSLDTTTP